MHIKNKRILLTGAAGGIGAAIASALAMAGASLILTGRDVHKLKRLQAVLPGIHHYVAADISSHEGRQHILQFCTDHGGIDVLINNAGISELSLLPQQSAEKLENMMQTNLMAPIWLCQLFLPMLKMRTEAAIINMGSTFGSIGYAGYSSYCASKFGLRGFTESLRRELADTAVHVMYIAPRATCTGINSDAVNNMNQQLGNKTDQPEQVAAIVCRALQKNRRQSFIGWPEKLFVRLNALLPRLVDNALRKQLHIIKHYAG